MWKDYFKNPLLPHPAQFQKYASGYFFYTFNYVGFHKNYRSSHATPKLFLIHYFFMTITVTEESKSLFCLCTRRFRWRYMCLYASEWNFIEGGKFYLKKLIEYMWEQVQASHNSSGRHAGSLHTHKRFFNPPYYMYRLKETTKISY